MSKDEDREEGRAILRTMMSGNDESPQSDNEPESDGGRRRKVGIVVNARKVMRRTPASAEAPTGANVSNPNLRIGNGCHVGDIGLVPTVRTPATNAIKKISESSGFKPRVALLSLTKASFFDAAYGPLLTDLKSRAEVIELTTPQAALTMLAATNKPDIILAADQALAADKKFAAVRQGMVNYVREDGGTLIFMGVFSSFTRPSDITLLFAAFGLPWESGHYHHNDFSVNATATHIDVSNLEPSYSQKALHLKNVEAGDAVYLASMDAQSPAVLGVCGAGRVGYLGDVNGEAESNRLVLALCGVAGP